MAKGAVVDIRKLLVRLRSVVPSSTSRLRCVNSQLVGPLPVRIPNHLWLICNLCLFIIFAVSTSKLLRKVDSALLYWHVV